jgi:hypothetical protein
MPAPIPSLRSASSKLHGGGPIGQIPTGGPFETELRGRSQTEVRNRINTIEEIEPIRQGCVGVGFKQSAQVSSK